MKTILPLATMWVKLEKIILHEINPNTEKMYTMYIACPYLYVESEKKIILLEAESRMVVTKGRSRTKQGNVGQRVQSICFGG